MPDTTPAPTAPRSAAGPAVADPAPSTQDARDLAGYEATVARQHAQEVAAGERFEFGKNWAAFLRTLDDERVRQSEQALVRMLGVTSLAGRTFLDAGSGSGLSSLAARNLGARVTSFDYDPDSVACTRAVRRRFRPDDPDWTVGSGSVLDAEYLKRLGAFDVVYSWGVLHHTGQMWPAVRNMLPMVRPGGQLFIAIYNDQGVWSHRWRRIKRLYCSGPAGRALTTAVVVPYWAARMVASDVFHGHGPLHTYTSYKRRRGMSITHDWFDWLGGLPFEVARPEEIILAVQREGFRLDNLVTQRGTVGCVEYVFTRDR